jgi:anti-sigma factor RsiW
MTCHELDSRLDDYLDGALTGADARAVEEHLAACAACQEREQQLRRLVAHAGALPRSLTPPRDLWPQIAERIERGSRWSWLLGSWQPAAVAAAAALAILAASLPWLRTPAAPTTIRAVSMPSPTAELRPVAGAAIADPALAAAVDNYETAARELLDALEQRRGLLPADDLARVEANIQVIDRALAEVREALAKDPESPELNRMLVATHKKKVDVLRRVVRLSTAL